MRKLCLLLSCAVLLLAGCQTRHRNVPRAAQPSDTLFTARRAMLTYVEDPDLALSIIDSAEVIGNVSPYLADFLRATVYTRSTIHPRVDEGIALCQVLLQQDSTRANTPRTADNRMNVLQLLTTAYRKKEDEEQWLKYALETAELNRKMGYEVECLRTDAEIGVVMTRLGRREEGLQKLNAAIDALSGGPLSVDRMDSWIVTVKRKINYLWDNGDMKAVIPLAQGIIDRLDDYQRHPGDYAEDSFRLEPDPTDRARYCDFYRAQAQGFLALACMETGDKDAMLRNLHTFEKSAYGQTPGGRFFIRPVWKSLGQWDKVLAIDDEREQMMGMDTLNIDYARILQDRADAARAQGRPAQAYGYLERSAALQAQLNRQRLESQAQTYAASYHAKEQELELHKIHLNSQRKNYLIGATLLALVLAALAALRYRHQRQQIGEKNQALVRLINEQNARPKTPVHEDSPDPALFRAIDSAIRTERLYANAALQRQDIVDRFSIRRQTLNDLLASFADGKSFPAYINDIRLEEAIQLLRDEPDMTISAIAESVGFTPSNLREQLKKRYGITPAEFRQSL